MSSKRFQRYILNADNQPVAEPDLLAWGRWMEDANRIVGYTQITSEVTVSTVFLGLDHRSLGDGPPILFETMVFCGNHGDDERRYSTWDDAETGHAMTVKRERAKLKQRTKS